MSLGLEAEWQTCLNQGRQREGFTPERIAERIAEAKRSQPFPWRNIAESDFIVRLGRELAREPADLVHQYVTAVVMRLPDQHRAVATSTLNLNREPVQLGQRQEFLSRELNVSSVATYREKYEKPALAALVRALDDPRREDLTALGVRADRLQELISVRGPASQPDRGHVVVVGAAVMDLSFVVTHMPDAGESVQALRFAASPGGKGLSQAVACARLGLKTSLISVIGDDENGRIIKAYLAEQGVDTDLIVERPNEHSSVTGVFTRAATGASSAIGWKNSHALHLGADFLDRPEVRQRIQDCHFLLCSFELPEPVVSKAIKLAHHAGAVTIVTPAPPFGEVTIEPGVGSHMDFVVANVWELKNISRRHTSVELPDLETISGIAEDLIVADQIKNVIVTHSNNCHAYLRGDDGCDPIQVLTVGGHGQILDSAGERDAFCAMLARRLHGASGAMPDTIEAVDWATAAMACVKAGTSVPDTMPTYDRVEKLIRQRGPRALAGNVHVEGEAQ